MMSPDIKELYMLLREEALKRVDDYERKLGLPRTAELRARVKALEQELAQNCGKLETQI
jgi:hypothetical protein